MSVFWILRGISHAKMTMIASGYGTVGEGWFFRICYITDSIRRKKISLLLCAEWDLPLLCTDGSGHTGNYWEPQRTKMVAWAIPKVWEQPRTQAEISDEIHLLYKTKLLRLGKGPFYLMHRNQYREWRKIRNKRICSKEKNKINCQKLILMK